MVTLIFVSGGFKRFLKIFVRGSGWVRVCLFLKV